MRLPSPSANLELGQGWEVADVQSSCTGEQSPRKRKSQGRKAPRQRTSSTAAARGKKSSRRASAMAVLSSAGDGQEVAAAAGHPSGSPVSGLASEPTLASPADFSLAPPATLLEPAPTSPPPGQGAEQTFCQNSLPAVDPEAEDTSCSTRPSQRKRPSQVRTRQSTKGKKLASRTTLRRDSQELESLPEPPEEGAHEEIDAPLRFPRSSPIYAGFDFDALEAELAKVTKPRRRASSSAACGRGRRSSWKRSASKPMRPTNCSDACVSSAVSLPCTICDGAEQAPPEKDSFL